MNLSWEWLVAKSQAVLLFQNSNDEKVDQKEYNSAFALKYVSSLAAFVLVYKTQKQMSTKAFL